MSEGSHTLELQKRLNQLKAAGHAEGERWLAAAMHPPTKSNNPGFPDSDSTASVRTNANLNYTIAPPGGIQDGQTWSCTIITNPNNPNSPGLALVYITDYYNTLKSYWVTPSPTGAGVTRQSVFDPYLACNVDYETSRGRGQNDCIALQADGSPVDGISDDYCVAYIMPIMDSYMPGVEDLIAWRCIGASNTSYLDCAEMFKQGMIYGSHAPRQTEGVIRMSGANCNVKESQDSDSDSYEYPINDFDPDSFYDHSFNSVPKPSSHTLELRCRIPSPHDVKATALTVVPGGEKDASYTATSVSGRTLAYTAKIMTVPNGDITILSAWMGYSPGEQVAVVGTTGSYVTVTGPDGTNQNILGTAYVAANSAGTIQGPVANTTDSVVEIAFSQLKGVYELNNLKWTPKWAIVADDDGKLYFALMNAVSTFNEGLISDVTVPFYTADIPLDRQSMQAASDMMQHEAKYGAYQVSRLYDSENPYKFAAQSANAVTTTNKDISSNGLGDPVALPVNNMTFMTYRYNDKDSSMKPIAYPANCRTDKYTPFPIPSTSMVIGDFYGARIATQPGGVQWPADNPAVCSGPLRASLPACNAWSLPISLYIGLSPQSTIQGKLARDIEMIPTPSSSMAALTSPGALSDEAAIYNGLILLNAIPVLMPERDNDLGSFLKAAWSAIKTYGPKLVPILSTANPVAGMAAGTALDVGKQIEKLVRDVREAKATANSAKQKAASAAAAKAAASKKK